MSTISQEMILQSSRVLLLKLLKILTGEWGDKIMELMDAVDSIYSRSRA